MRFSTRLFVLIIVVACLATAGGFVARRAIERTIFVRAAQSAFGADLDVSDASYANGTWDVRDLTVGTDVSPVHVQAPHASIANVDGVLSVTADAPIVTVPGGADVANGAPALRDAFATFARAHDRASIRLSGGSVHAGTDVALEAIDGTFAIAAGRASYDGTMDLAYGGARYPVTARSTSGSPAQSFTAVALPAAAFALFEPANAQSKPISGTIADVDAQVTTTLHATARLNDVGFALGEHRLSRLHGDLTFDGGGVGTKRIAGFLDTVPLDATGEVHDLPGPYAWLVTGSRELQAYGALVGRIAAEPHLRSVHFDTTAPGVGFAQYATITPDGPLAVSVLAIDPAEPTLRLDTAIAEDHVISKGERTSSMGVRTGAVAGVNGDYFDIGRTYEPQGLLVRGSQIVRGPVDRAALVIDKTKHVRFDEFHIVGSMRAGARVFPITQLNDWPVGEVTVITPAFGTTLPPADGVTFVSLARADRPNRYRVERVDAATRPLPVTFGIAIGADVRLTLRAGDFVDVSYRLEPNVADAVAAIGGGPILVRNGMPYEDPHAPAPDERDHRWPVIALARVPDDGLLLVAVDGRHPERSIGMTRPDFADLLVRFGATDAMALDSGGSVTMVSRAPGNGTVTVRNVPSDNSAERWVSDALYVYSSAPPPTIVAPTVAQTPVPEARPTY